MTSDKTLIIFLTIFVALAVLPATRSAEENEDDPFKTTDPRKREPSPCEICKFFAKELMSRLDESSKSKEVIETGHGLDKRKRFKYLTSELRLTEALHEPHICEKILEYNVHAERKGSLRYAKGMSETMQTLHGLVNKGVKVELGIPYELWDKPSAEVSKMHRACFTFAEQYEEVIESWYYEHQEEDNLISYLCAQRFLKGKDQQCLQEIFFPKGDTGSSEEEEDKQESKKKKKAVPKPKGDKSGAKRESTTTNEEQRSSNPQRDDRMKDEDKERRLKKGDNSKLDDEMFTGDHVTPEPEIVSGEIPRPDHVPVTSPLPKTGRIDGDL